MPLLLYSGEMSKSAKTYLKQHRHAKEHNSFCRAWRTGQTWFYRQNRVTVRPTLRNANLYKTILDFVVVHPERGVPPHPERGSTSAPSGTVPLSRAGSATPDPSDARGSFRAIRKVRSERYERFVPSDAKGSLRAMRKARSGRCEGFVPSDARDSFRAMREARSERCERFVPSDAKGSLRAMREARSERCERFVPSDARGSLRAMRMVRSELCERFEQGGGKHSLYL